MTGAGTPEPTRPTTAIDAIAEEWVTTVADLDPDIAVWIGIPGRHGEYADLSPAGHSRLVTAAKPAVAPWWAVIRRRRTRQGVRTWPPRSATARPVVPGCRGSSPSTAAVRPAGSPPARSVWARTDVTSGSRSLVRCAPASPLASWPARSRAEPRASARLSCRGSAGGGTFRFPSRYTTSTLPRVRAVGSLVWTSVSSPWPCCPPVSACPTRADSTPPYADCAEPNAPAPGVAARTGRLQPGQPRCLHRAQPKALRRWLRQ